MHFAILFEDCQRPSRDNHVDIFPSAQLSLAATPLQREDDALPETVGAKVCVAWQSRSFPARRGLELRPLHGRLRSVRAHGSRGKNHGRTLFDEHGDFDVWETGLERVKLGERKLAERLHCRRFAEASIRPSLRKLPEAFAAGEIDKMFPAPFDSLAPQGAVVFEATKKAQMLAIQQNQ